MKKYIIVTLVSLAYAALLLYIMWAFAFHTLASIKIFLLAAAAILMGVSFCLSVVFFCAGVQDFYEKHIE